ncbi:nucleotide sugar dehydrogenase [Flavobacteriaceae bacterium]|nr:nucleotide sugar dehydrogenase [Flavobacteriaceae bacterium]
MKETRIGIIGLGYVGLPLAVACSKHFETIGFDINKSRIKDLNQGKDQTLEVSESDLRDALSKDLSLDSSIASLENCNFYIVTVPTPVDKNNNPDFSPLESASKTIAQVIAKDDVVVFESTVYPGATEEICVPIIERISGLTFNKDFFVGYSPERINPGDKNHTVTKILKVTSGSTEDSAKYIDRVYKTVITAGTHLAPSIRVAEAAKVIENSQRDINIAFVNELAKIFSKLDIDTSAVLEAAGTKWNFLPFKPGLVGGHCIGVDPYYLAQKATQVGYNPEIILAGRRLNDSMGAFVSAELIKIMISKDLNVKGARVLLMGITFKENCPDIRNTRAIDIYHELKSYKLEVDVYDPCADPIELKKEYGINLIQNPVYKDYSGIVLAVAHKEFKTPTFDTTLLNQTAIYDVKSIWPTELVDGRL